MAIELSASNFEKEVSGGDLPVLVDFWAAWCGPCRAQSPVLERLDPKKVKVCKVNVDENPDLSQKFGIMNIPTLIVFKNGKAVRQVAGLHTQKQIEALL